MSVKTKSPLQRVISMLLCVAILMSLSAPVWATETDTPETTAAAGEVSPTAEPTTVPREVSVTVTAVNTFDEDTASANTAIIANDRTASNLGISDFADRTGFVIEKMSSDVSVDSDTYSFVVDAVLPGDSGSTSATPVTVDGFILYISNDVLAAMDRMPSRGDMVKADFTVTTSGYNADGLGKITFRDNATYEKEISLVEPADLNATVKLFNYDATINSQGPNTTSSTRYGFWSDVYGYSAKTDTVDGAGTKAASTIYMHNELVDGYPKFGTSSRNKQAYSMDYLFNGKSTRADGSSTQIAEMSNGGGLFQMDEDGYYYYDSLKNAAWYNPDTKQFEVYADTIVRPWYDSDSTSNEAYGNFLPFNRVTSDNITADNVLDLPEDSWIWDGWPSVIQGIVNGSQVPKDGLGVGTVARLEEPVDLWYGMTVEYDFFMPKDGKIDDEPMIFDFKGDDDVLVYIDDVLVLDISGTHAAQSGSINFATGAIESPNETADTLAELFEGKDILRDDTFADYTHHKLKFFYLERGGNVSYCRLRFNLPTLPENSLTVTKVLEGGEEEADATEFITNSYDYQFRVVKADAEGKPTDEPFISNETFAIMEDGVQVGTGTVDGNGIFTLKHGQSAQFNNMLIRSQNGAIKYVVQELIPENIDGQYGDIIYDIHNIGVGVIDESDGTVTNFKDYSTPALSPDAVQNVIFRNEVEYTHLTSLSITKKLGEDAETTLAGQTYTMQVWLGDELLPVGTKYTVGAEEKTVETAGQVQLKADETAQIGGILSGTEFLVKELINGDYEASYSGTITGQDGYPEAANATANGVSGTIPLGGSAAVTVTNNSKSENGVETDKKVEATNDPNEFELTLEAYVKGQTATISNTQPADIVLVLDQSASMYTPIGWDADRAYATDRVTINNTLSSLKISDFVTKAQANDPELLENAKRLGYYIAVHQKYDYIYIVQYAQNEAGEWGWYYVPVDQTTRSVKVDTENTTDDSAKALEQEYGTYVHGNAELLTNVNYYRSQSAALYDSVKEFVEGLNASNVNHRVGVVGFASSFYDGWDDYDGTGLYVNGTYYVYDSDFMYKDESGNILDPDATYGGDEEILTIIDPSETDRNWLMDNTYKFALADISTPTGYSSVLNSIEAIRTNYQQTCPSAGMEIANNIFKSNASTDREKIVVLFTDGVPTVKLASDRDDGRNKADLENFSEFWTISGGMEDAITKAKELKDNGVNIYTIGTSAMSDTNTNTYGGMTASDFLKYVSSDNPDATCTGKYDSTGNDEHAGANKWQLTPSPATPAEGNYANFAAADEDLNVVFDSVLESVTTVTANLDENSVLRDVLTEYFELNGDAETAISVYTAAYKGNGEFDDENMSPLESAVVNVKDTDGDGHKETIEVSGFDYAANYVAEATAGGEAVRGQKLVVKIKVKTREGFWGGNNVPTNDDDTGLYPGGDTPPIEFPEPQVNVPLDLSILAKDAVIYYGSDVDHNDLLEFVTAGGLPVDIGSDGTLTPKAEWMDDFAVLVWTSGKVKPGDPIDNKNPDDYTYSVTMVPTSDGSTNTEENPGNIAGTPVTMTGTTAEDNAHVDILIPIIPFEDSTIEWGYKPDEAYFVANDLVSDEIRWVLINDIDIKKEATKGEPPELDFEYTPSGTLDGGANYESDTKIDVTVTGTYGTDEAIDLNDVAYFEWKTCEENLHKDEQEAIVQHKANTENQHEFWIHVATDNGLVTDKYVTGTDNPNEFVLTLEAYAQGLTETIDVILDETAILKEVLTDYFVLNPEDEAAITVYTAAYDGKGSFADKQAFDDATVTLSSSEGTGENARIDTIEVSGFDYQEEYLSSTARTKEDGTTITYGSKLIVEVRVKTRDGFWGGNNVPTNEADTGIYDKNDVLVEGFPEPEVNVPIDVEVVAKDKTIYYGGDVTGKDLIESVTAGGMEVTVNNKGTFSPKEDWMNDYADLSWTSTSTEPDKELDNLNPKDYTFEVQLKPKYDGSDNQSGYPGNIAGTPVVPEGDTDSDTGHVYILVPEVTFKDSTTDFGTSADGYGYTKNDYVSTEWVNMETDLTDGTVVPPVDESTKPTLTLTYKAESDVFTDDTKVEVTITSSNTDGDISSVTTFKWADCDHEMHQGTDGTKISDHKANTENQHEFWIHVTLKIEPDTVVIDFGLPVDIDPLTNDLNDVANVTKVLTGIGAEFGDRYTGSFGTAAINEGKNTVRYTLNTSNGMQMNREETFKYQGSYTINRSGMTAESTITVIPATIIYYEDNFVDYATYDYESFTEITGNPAKMWDEDGEQDEAVQGTDRPGKDRVSTDMNNIYGYDAAYLNSQKFSLNSAHKVTVDDTFFAEAVFTFTGTGFDVIALSSNTTGTISVDIYNADEFNADGGYNHDATLYRTYMVDTYYGYEYSDSDSDDKKDWHIVDSHSPNALYQVPVMKVDLSEEIDGYKALPYGTYTAVITVAYSSVFDHEQYGTDGKYDFMLDAIRIYDQANDGADNKVIEDAYVADGEGWPSYTELRDMLIDANTFDSLSADDEVPGVIFIDGIPELDDSTASGTEGDVSDNIAGKTAAITDYANFGPNNELYLAPGQAVSFTLNAENAKNIHLALKSVGETAKVKIYDAADPEKTNILGGTKEDPSAAASITTATDLYYDITSLNNKTVVITNTGGDSDAILSITNIKRTYESDPGTATETVGVFAVSRSSAAMALASLMPDEETEEPEVPSDSTEPEVSTDPTEPEVPTDSTEPEAPIEPTEPEEPSEPEVFEPKTLTAYLSDSSVKAGSTVTLVVNTKRDVDSISVNGEMITNYSENRWIGTRTWIYRISADTVGKIPFEVVAYNEDGLASAPVVKTLTVTEQYTSVGDWLKDLIGGLIGSLLGGR